MLLAAPTAMAAGGLERDAQRVYDDYRSDGAVSPCRHTVGVYRTTLKEITSGIEEESPAFRPAVEAALEAREHEMCGEASTGGGSGSASSGSSSPGGAVPIPVDDSGAAPTSPPGDGGSAPAEGEPGAAAAPPTGGTPAQPGQPAAPAAPPAAAAEQVLLNRPYQGTPTGLVIAAALLAAALLAVLAAAAAQRFGWGDERLAGARHAWGEAAYRAGGAWGDFLDWVRLGR